MRTITRETELFVRNVRIKKKKKHKDTFTQNENTASHQQSEIIDNSNRNLKTGFSNCGITYLRNYILLQKQKPSFIITKSQNQYPKVKI